MLVLMSFVVVLRFDWSAEMFAHRTTFAQAVTFELVLLYGHAFIITDILIICSVYV